MSEVEEEKIAFVALENNDESDDSDKENVDIEETREKYKQLYLNFDKVKKQNDGLKIKVQKNEDEWQRTETSLRSQVNNLLAERYLLKEQLKEAKEKLHRLITGDEKLDRMIEMGKPNGDKTSIGFKPFSSTNYVTKFVKHIINSNIVAFDIASKNMNATILHDNVMTRPKRFNQVCHDCGEIGHIRPRCQK